MSLKQAYQNLELQTLTREEFKRFDITETVLVLNIVLSFFVSQHHPLTVC